MDRLLVCLHEIEQSELPDVPPHEDMFLHNDDHEKVAEVIAIATSLFVGKEGQPVFDDMDAFWHDHGYFIFPGERDRSGWVTACLQTKKGIIVFG